MSLEPSQKKRWTTKKHRVGTKSMAQAGGNSRPQSKRKSTNMFASKTMKTAIDPDRQVTIRRVSTVEMDSVVFEVQWRGVVTKIYGQYRLESSPPELEISLTGLNTYFHQSGEIDEAENAQTVEYLISGIILILQSNMNSGRLLIRPSLPKLPNTLLPRVFALPEPRLLTSNDQR